MTRPTAYIEINKLHSDRSEDTFYEGYAWDTDAETRLAFYQAKARFEVPFEHAAYLVDLYQDQHEMIETFPMAELGYRTLTKAA